MTRAPEKMRGATDLALHFNLRYHGEPVSPQTTHKWLTARSIPTADKLATLAEWFKVEQHWLHYGPPPSGNPQNAPKPITHDEKYPASEETLELASKIEALSSHHRYLLEELIDQFYGGGWETVDSRRSVAFVLSRVAVSRCDKKFQLHKRLFLPFEIEIRRSFFGCLVIYL